MELSVVIVSYNVKDKLRENLKALLASKVDFEFEVIVVDNNSEDETVQMLRQEFPQVELVANDLNFGFAKANNQVLRHLDSPFALLLNPDMRVNQNTLSKMMSWMKKKSQVAIAGCRLTDDQGDIIKHVRRFPKLVDQLAIVLKLPHFFPQVLSKYIREDFDYSQASQVDSVRGGFMLLNMKVLRNLPHNLRSTLPIFDERYFLWFEEVDLCRQVKVAGGEVWYTPEATCVDLVGQSFKKLPRGLTQTYFRDSMLKYFKKWHRPWQYLTLKLAWPIGKAMAVLGEKIGWNRSKNVS